MSALVWIYHDLADMERQCPNLECLAPPNEYCRRPDGYLRRVPCIARMLTLDAEAYAVHDAITAAERAPRGERSDAP